MLRWEDGVPLANGKEAAAAAAAEAAAAAAAEIAKAAGWDEVADGTEEAAAAQARPIFLAEKDTADSWEAAEVALSRMEAAGADAVDSWEDYLQSEEQPKPRPPLQGSPDNAAAAKTVDVIDSDDWEAADAKLWSTSRADL